MPPLRTPDHALLSPREAISEFYLAFSRYEFALKAAGFAKQTDRGAQVDWDGLAAELGDIDHLLMERKSEFDELISAPPKKLNVDTKGQLSWGDDLPRPTWTMTRVFLYRVQAVRNNLMHGSKFIDHAAINPDREARLLRAAMSSLEIILDRLPRARDAFHSAAN